MVNLIQSYISNGMVWEIEDEDCQNGNMIQSYISNMEGTLIKNYSCYLSGIINESMISFVSRHYVGGENGKESLLGLSCLQICIGKQNVEIIDK